MKKVNVILEIVCKGQQQIYTAEPDLAISSHVNIKMYFVFLLSWYLEGVDGFYKNLSYRNK